MKAERSFTPEAMRTVLGSFCSGVTVVTALGDEPLGFTCQSFTSLSLDPPLVVLCPADISTTWPRIRGIGRFCVNVLADDQQHISSRFARSGGGKYTGLGWTPAPSGAPVLDGAIAWIDCTLWAEYSGGDHTVVVGEVRDLSACSDRNPLLFYRSAYRRTGPEIPRTEPARWAPGKVQASEQ
jgi:3-hydroxy-9,10-secoandrosta-1,3,5(10)-triene-9,17-dione monooxygenase reductase component